jgi:predicted homoserine dehydrogenase-like protein
MSLYAGLQKRAAEGRPLRVGLIGAGKFGAMYLAQVPKTPGIHLAAIADLSPSSAIVNLQRVGWAPERFAAHSIDDALRHGTTHVGDDWPALLRHPAIDIVVECTGNPIAAVEHCLDAFRQRKNVVNVTVEADAFCGPLLARKAAEAGVVYSLAFGDQPALICDLVDWARAAGFGVVAAGRGHKWLPHFAQSTPETVWGHYGLTPEQARTGGLNPKMFNSFLDGSKPSIECTAVCNATGLAAPPDGLTYPPASIDDIPSICRPRAEGGVLHQKGQVEVISSLERDGHPSATTSASSLCRVRRRHRIIRSQKSCAQSAAATRACTSWHRHPGRHLRRRWAARQATGAATCFKPMWCHGKRDLAAGGRTRRGDTVWGKLLLRRRAAWRLPLGCPQREATRAVRQGESLLWSDVAIDDTLPAYKTRREMETLFGPGGARVRPSPRSVARRQTFRGKHPQSLTRVQGKAHGRTQETEARQGRAAKA